MYSVDCRDAVVELVDFPQSSVGAPCPTILAAEHGLRLAYYLEETLPGGDGTTIRTVSERSTGQVAVVEFLGACAHMFGPPNDEAFEGHPLASRGLEPYSTSEVLSSSWVRSLERMNRVHERHSPETYASCRHFIFAFHDTAFEFVADDFRLSLQRGSASAAIHGASQERRRAMRRRSLRNAVTRARLALTRRRRWPEERE
jgi:hypothetical protein